MLKNTNTGYGLIAIAMHWVSAIAVIGMFALGFWMVDLTYYSSWYKTAPDIHKSVGLLLFVLILCRLLWRSISIKPQTLASHRLWETQLAHVAHRLLYLLLVLIMISGYLISTADGRGIAFFDWFMVPSLGELFDNQADLAGSFHQYAAYVLIALVVLHALGALKHHFIDKDNTLTRMLSLNKSSPSAANKHDSTIN
ncbi:cytochrome b [Shewanella gaetbuli]|uniref:Cytochrome b n=1 Tax=Shewanella gaetbuli TaxID=220752 RepID=A0A9X1ZL68_9GAMM|nr:cytochrome b [Shewanella gaetbuli]MCL1141870.1 cytochrome b [Shewanella gaetbuli]